MKVINEFPPLYSRIVEVFPHAAQPGVIFAWGDTIYKPYPPGPYLAPAIIAHEEVHGQRQLSGIVAEDADPVRTWWKCYLDDQNFRYGEEVRAHAAEFKSQLPLVQGREMKSQLLNVTAFRLIAKMYNYQPHRSLQKALRDIQACVRGEFE